MTPEKTTPTEDLPNSQEVDDESIKWTTTTKKLNILRRSSFIGLGPRRGSSIRRIQTPRGLFAEVSRICTSA